MQRGKRACLLDAKKMDVWSAACMRCSSMWVTRYSRELRWRLCLPHSRQCPTQDAFSRIVALTFGMYFTPRTGSSRHSISPQVVHKLTPISTPLALLHARSPDARLLAQLRYEPGARASVKDALSHAKEKRREQSSWT